MKNRNIPIEEILKTEFSEPFAQNVIRLYPLKEPNKKSKYIRSFVRDDQPFPESFVKFFIDGMRNRMVVSFVKYGYLALAYPTPVKAIESIELRLQRYEEGWYEEKRVKSLGGAWKVEIETHKAGNTEWLMDVGNFSLIEFMRPSVELNDSGKLIELPKKDRIKFIRWAAEQYKTSADVQYLFAICGAAMLEFINPSSKKPYYIATDTAASPGRVVIDSADGEEFTTIADNDSLQNF